MSSLRLWNSGGQILKWGVEFWLIIKQITSARCLKARIHLTKFLFDRIRSDQRELVHLCAEDHPLCGICTVTLLEGAVGVTRCGHLFHRSCFKEWTEFSKFQNSVCPACNSLYKPFISVYGLEAFMIEEIQTNRSRNLGLLIAACTERDESLQKLANALSEEDETKKKLATALSEKDETHIANALSEKDETKKKLATALSEKDEIQKKLVNTLKEENKTKQNLAKALKNLSNALSDQDATQERLAKALSKKDAINKNLSTALRERDESQIKLSTVSREKDDTQKRLANALSEKDEVQKTLANAFNVNNENQERLWTALLGKDEVLNELTLCLFELSSENKKLSGLYESCSKEALLAKLMFLLSIIWIGKII